MTANKVQDIILKSLERIETSFNKRMDDVCSKQDKLVDEVQEVNIAFTKLQAVHIDCPGNRALKQFAEKSESISFWNIVWKRPQLILYILLGAGIVVGGSIYGTYRSIAKKETIQNMVNQNTQKEQKIQ